MRMGMRRQDADEKLTERERLGKKVEGEGQRGSLRRKSREGKAGLKPRNEEGGGHGRTIDEKLLILFFVSRIWPRRGRTQKREQQMDGTYILLGTKVLLPI
jgi:hypothetical protein